MIGSVCVSGKYYGKSFDYCDGFEIFGWIERYFWIEELVEYMGGICVYG